MSEYLSILGWIGFALGVIGVASMVFFTVGLRLERRAIRDLKPTEPVTDRSRFEFLIKSNNQAESLGLIGPQWYEDTTGLLGRAKYAMWMNNDSRILMLIVQNSTAIAYEKIILLSKLDEERVLKTVNGDGEHDLLGYTEYQLKTGARPLELMALHLARLDLRKTPPLPMKTRPALLEFEALERTRVQRLVDRRLAVWLTGDDEPWRHTTLGAFLAYLQFIRAGFWKMIRDSIREGAREGWKDEDEADNNEGEAGLAEPESSQDLKAEA